MRYLIYDNTTNKLGELQNVSSIQWKPRYNERGQVEIHAAQTSDNMKYLLEGNRIVCVDRKEIMFIKYVEYDDESNTITINGYMDNLDYRINNGTARIKVVETGLYSLVNSNKRGLRIENSSTKGLSASFTSYTETSYDELIDTVVDMCQSVSLGFRVLFRVSDYQNIFEIYEGQEKRDVRFSDTIGNVMNQKYIKDLKNYKNKAYVYGGESGTARSNVTVDRVRAGEETYELYVDARDLQRDKFSSNSEYTQALIDRGNSKLDEAQKSSKIFEFDPIENGVSGVFGEDYDIGDIVPVVSHKYGLSTWVRIVGANFIEEEGKELKITLEVELERQVINT